MKTLETISNEYAKTQGCKNWDHLITRTITRYPIDFATHEITTYLHDVCELVQREQQKVIVEKAEILIQDGQDYEVTGHGTSIGKYSVKVYKPSIVNDKNIIR